MVMTPKQIAFIINETTDCTMKKQHKFRAAWIVAAALAVVGAIAWTLKGDGAASGTDMQLSSAAMAGRADYNAFCAECHGINGSGTDKGPTFVHAVYNPGHHSDAAFARAVAQGVRQHHWRFGDMPAQPEVTDAQLEAIVRYVRAVQESNGITYQAHRM